MIKNLIPNEKISFITERLKAETDGLTGLRNPLNSIRELIMNTMVGRKDTATAILIREGEV